MAIKEVAVRNWMLSLMSLCDIPARYRLNPSTSKVPL